MFLFSSQTVCCRFIDNFSVRDSFFCITLHSKLLPLERIISWIFMLPVVNYISFKVFRVFQIFNLSSRNLFSSCVLLWSCWSAKPEVRLMSVILQAKRWMLGVLDIHIYNSITTLHDLAYFAFCCINNPSGKWK